MLQALAVETFFCTDQRIIEETRKQFEQGQRAIWPQFLIISTEKIETSRRSQENVYICCSLTCGTLEAHKKSEKRNATEGFRRSVKFVLNKFQANGRHVRACILHVACIILLRRNKMVMKVKIRERQQRKGHLDFYSQR